MPSLKDTADACTPQTCEAVHLPLDASASAAAAPASASCTLAEMRSCMNTLVAEPGSTASKLLTATPVTEPSRALAVQPALAPSADALLLVLTLAIAAAVLVAVARDVSQRLRSGSPFISIERRDNDDWPATWPWPPDAAVKRESGSLDSHVTAFAANRTLFAAIERHLT